jgi:hypothetical protein
MKDLKIEVPEGYEIDLEKSDLGNGVVKFKRKETKLPESLPGLEH